MLNLEEQISFTTVSHVPQFVDAYLYRRFARISKFWDMRHQRLRKLSCANAHVYATSRGVRPYAIPTFEWWCKNMKETCWYGTRLGVSISAVQFSQSLCDTTRHYYIPIFTSTSRRLFFLPTSVLSCHISYVPK